MMKELRKIWEKECGMKFADEEYIIGTLPMSDEPQKDWRERFMVEWARTHGLNTVSDQFDFGHSTYRFFENFIESERRKVAEEMAKAVVPEESDGTNDKPESRGTLKHGYNACRSEVQRRAEEFIKTLE